MRPLVSKLGALLLQKPKCASLWVLHYKTKLLLCIGFPWVQATLSLYLVFLHISSIWVSSPKVLSSIAHPFIFRCFVFSPLISIDNVLSHSASWVSLEHRTWFTNIDFKQSSFDVTLVFDNSLTENAKYESPYNIFLTHWRAARVWY